MCAALLPKVLSPDEIFVYEASPNTPLKLSDSRFRLTYVNLAAVSTTVPSCETCRDVSFSNW